MSSAVDFIFLLWASGALCVPLPILYKNTAHFFNQTELIYLCLCFNCLGDQTNTDNWNDIILIATYSAVIISKLSLIIATVNPFHHLSYIYPISSYSFLPWIVSAVKIQFIR